MEGGGGDESKYHCKVTVNKIRYLLVPLNKLWKTIQIPKITIFLAILVLASAHKPLNPKLMVFVSLNYPPVCYRQHPNKLGYISLEIMGYQSVRDFFNIPIGS